MFYFFLKLNKLQKFVFNNLLLLLQSCLGKNEIKKNKIVKKVLDLIHQK